MNATSSSSTAPGPTDRVGAPSSSSLWRPALGVSRVGNQVRQHCRCDRAARRVPSAMSGQPKDGSPETRREWRCTRLSSSSRPGRWRSKPSLSVRVGRSACAEGAGDDSHPRTLPPGSRMATRLWGLIFGRRSADPRRTELRRIGLFAALPRKRFDLLVRTADIVEVPAGTVLIREGETGREFFAIAEGEVEISSGGEAITEQAGDVFGELALLYDVSRTATVRTTAPSRLFVLTAHAFRSVVAPSFS
jgi:CRP/FNR family transcriptional regulator, cyclic AMP receptor protein